MIYCLLLGAKCLGYLSKKKKKKKNWNEKKRKEPKKKDVQIFHKKYCKIEIMKYGETSPSTAEGGGLFSEYGACL